MRKFTIIIPVFNEEGNIENLINEIVNSLKIYNEKYEILIVNDASTDNSKKIINKLFLQNQNLINYINNEINKGQSFSIKEGIRNSKYETIITIDGDGQNDPKDIYKLLDKYFSDPAIGLVGGIRKNRKDSFNKIISSKIANYVRQLILKDNCNDTGCSLKVFDKKTFLNFPFFNGIHRFLPAIYKGTGKKCYFINVNHRYRKFGNSKYGTLNRLLYGIRDMIKVKKLIK